MANELKFTVRVLESELAPFMAECDMGIVEIAGMLRNSLEKGGFCYSCTVDEEAPRWKKLLSGGA